MISRLWPKTRRAWIYVAFFAIIFLVLDALALMGVGLAVGLLATLAGGIVGVLLALAAAYPLIRNLPRGGMWRTLWFFAGIGSTFGILVGGSAVAGIPLFPTAEGGNIGAFIYGLALGFGSAACNFALGGGMGSTFTGILFEDAESRGEWARVFILVCVAVVGLLALCFAGYLAVEYIVAPIARSFA